MDRWEDAGVKACDRDQNGDLSSLEANSQDSVAVSLSDVETELRTLLDELRGLQYERQAAHIEPQANDQRSQLEWDSSLENFLLKATVIRRMLSQFRGSDLSTRRYLRHQLDEEFENLKSAYGSLSEQFTTN